jgi:catechol 2,3-dioxygenase-like lactoylglutathione lyase family enzyme
MFRKVVIESLAAAMAFVISCSFVYGSSDQTKAPQQAKAQVIIIGTLHKWHYENPQYSPAVLKKLINSLKPNAILNELPLSQVDPNGRPLFRDPNQHPEGWAADSVAMQLGIKQIPFDQPDREEIFRKTHYFEREKNSNELLNKWGNQLAVKEPNSVDLKTVQLLSYAGQAQYNISHQAGPEIINSDGFDSVIRMKHSLQYDVVPAIIKKYPGYERLVEDQKFFKDHWNQRNNTMADNIVNAAQKHKGKRLVVVTGCEHRYILRDLLKDVNSIELKEYWEVPAEKENTMKIKFHEIELSAKDPNASKKFYHEILGLPVAVDQEGLKVFDSGRPGIDVDVSTHNPGKTSMSFLVDNLDKFAAELRAKGIKVDGPYSTHLGMRAIELEDPDGHKIEIQSPTQKSPQWLKDMVK